MARTSAWKKVVNATIKNYLRFQEEQIMQNRILLLRLQASDIIRNKPELRQRYEQLSPAQRYIYLLGFTDGLITERESFAHYKSHRTKARRKCKRQKRSRGSAT